MSDTGIAQPSSGSTPELSSGPGIQGIEGGYNDVWMGQIRATRGRIHIPAQVSQRCMASLYSLLGCQPRPYIHSYSTHEHALGTSPSSSCQAHVPTTLTSSITAHYGEATRPNSPILRSRSPTSLPIQFVPVTLIGCTPLAPSSSPSSKNGNDADPRVRTGGKSLVGEVYRHSVVVR